MNYLVVFLFFMILLKLISFLIFSDFLSSFLIIIFFFLYFSNTLQNIVVWKDTFQLNVFELLFFLYFSSLYSLNKDNLLVIGCILQN